jgi:hypothetical protein
MTFLVEVASSPDRDELVAEIWWNEQMVAEIRKAPDGARFVDVYPSPSCVPWSFDLEDLLAALNQANRRLG